MVNLHKARNTKNASFMNKSLLDIGRVDGPKMLVCRASFGLGASNISLPSLLVTKPTNSASTYGARGTGSVEDPFVASVFGSVVPGSTADSSTPLESAL
jgi:hypothetical protein